MLHRSTSLPDHTMPTLRAWSKNLKLFTTSFFPFVMAIKSWSAMFGISCSHEKKDSIVRTVEFVEPVSVIPDLSYFTSIDGNWCRFKDINQDCNPNALSVCPLLLLFSHKSPVSPLDILSPFSLRTSVHRKSSILFTFYLSAPSIPFSLSSISVYPVTGFYSICSSCRC